MTQRRHAGGYGLWCAGAIPNSPSGGWSTFGGIYPAYTAGMVDFPVPELSDYYSATLDYWYDLPSVGSRDGDAFNVAWATGSSDLWDGHAGQPLATAMTDVAYSLSAPTPSGASRPVNLSRTAGRVRFLFIDDVDTYESPSVGEGATIDDVSVSGYMFGPVRNLAAVEAGGQVTVTWAKPARSTALLAPVEERPVAYRVWRSPNVQPYVWTEVTPARTSATTFTDTDPLDGTARYIVQAWTPADDSGWGEVDVASGALVTVIPPVPVSTIAVNGASTSGIFTELPTITVTRSTARGTTFYWWDAAAVHMSTTDQSLTVPALAGTHTLHVYSANSLGTAESPEKTRVIVVNLPGPPPVAPETTITVAGDRNAAGTYTTTPTITVSRDLSDGTTYFRWDGASYDATTAASFQLPAVAGAHTLEVYSVSGGTPETSTKSRLITVSVAPVLTTPSLSTPTISTSYVRHNRAFYVRGTVKTAHAVPTTVLVRLYRYYSGAYHYYKTVTVTVKPGATTYSAKVTLSRTGTYRVRTWHSCPLHIGTYSAYKKFVVHT